MVSSFVIQRRVPMTLFQQPEKSSVLAEHCSSGDGVVSERRQRVSENTRRLTLLLGSSAGSQDLATHGSQNSSNDSNTCKRRRKLVREYVQQLLSVLPRVGGSEMLSQPGSVSLFRSVVLFINVF